MWPGLIKNNTITCLVCRCHKSPAFISYTRNEDDMGIGQVPYRSLASQRFC